MLFENVNRRTFLSGVSAFGLAAIFDRAAYAQLSVSRDFLRNLSACWERFVAGTDEFQYALVVAEEDGIEYMTSYVLETVVVKDIGHSYKIKRLKKNEPLTVRIREINDLSKPIISLTDTDLDGVVDHLFVEKAYGGAVLKTPIGLMEIPQTHRQYNQDQYERGLRALTRKMNI